SHFTQSYFCYRWHRPLLRARSRSWRVSPVIGQVRALNMRVPADDYAPDIARSTPGGFRTAARLSSRIVPAPRSTPDRQSLVAKRLVYADGLRANSRPSWSTDFLKQSERRWRGRMRIPTS